MGFREQFIHRTGAKTATPVGKWLLREKTAACVHHGADSGYSEMMHWRISKVPLFLFFLFWWRKSNIKRCYMKNCSDQIRLGNAWCLYRIFLITFVKYKVFAFYCSKINVIRQLSKRILHKILNRQYHVASIPKNILWEEKCIIV